MTIFHMGILCARARKYVLLILYARITGTQSFRRRTAVQKLKSLYFTVHCCYYVDESMYP